MTKTLSLIGAALLCCAVAVAHGSTTRYPAADPIGSGLGTKTFRGWIDHAFVAAAGRFDCLAGTQSVETTANQCDHLQPQIEHKRTALLWYREAVTISAAVCKHNTTEHSTWDVGTEVHYDVIELHPGTTSDVIGTSVIVLRQTDSQTTPLQFTFDARTVAGPGAIAIARNNVNSIASAGVTNGDFTCEFEYSGR